MQGKSEKKLLAPVLDRLLDANRDADFVQPHQIMRHLRESVRRDLEFLFNTRYRCISPPEKYEYLQQSNMNYGLPDLSTINLTCSRGRKDFCRQLERTILDFEPRFKSVKVRTEDKVDNENPSIRFRVEAVLHTNPSSEIIVFDSALNPITQTVDVSEIM